MWYVVSYWDHDPDVGEFLNQHKFDLLSDALVFAEEKGAMVTSPMGLKHYRRHGDKVQVFYMDWKTITTFDELIEMENES